MAKKKLPHMQKMPTEGLDQNLTVHYAGESQFDTLAITESERQEPESGVPLPSRQNIKEAKDWVDNNEK